MDVTFGAGGHTRAILEQNKTCKVIAMDWDALTLETYGPIFEEEFGDRISFIWGNFSLLYKLIKKHNIGQVDGSWPILELRKFRLPKHQDSHSLGIPRLICDYLPPINK